MRVHRIQAPQIGKTVVFFEEYRATQPGQAHRQRVVSLVLEPASQRIRAVQWFFKTGPTHDRKPLDPAAVAKLGRVDFTFFPTCDLYFDYEPGGQRYRAGMLPKACICEHPNDGQVHADLKMLLHPTQLWYRDRSIRLPNGAARGEIDGFCWLLFYRSTALPFAQNQGVWKGMFRLCDAEGRLTAEFPSEIIARIEDRGGQQLYRHINRYTPPDAPQQVIESTGEVRERRVWFENERLSGWSMNFPAGTSGRGSVIVMDYKDG